MQLKLQRFQQAPGFNLIMGYYTIRLNPIANKLFNIIFIGVSICTKGYLWEYQDDQKTFKISNLMSLLEYAGVYFISC